MANREDGYVTGGGNTGLRRSRLPQLCAAALGATAFFIDQSGARRRYMIVQRQEENRQKQENTNPTPADCGRSRELEGLHGDFKYSHYAPLSNLRRADNLIRVLAKTHW